MDGGRLAPAVLELVREELVSAGMSPSTINGTLSAIRSLVRHQWRAGLLSHQQRARLEDVGGARGSRLPSGRHVEASELLAIAKACADGSIVGLRDVALIALAATTRLPRAELVALNIENVDA